MFNRFLAITFSVFLVSFLAISVYWQGPSANELYCDSPLVKAHRLSQDLGGKWDSYSSLRQAWAQENRFLKGDDNDVITGLIQVDSIVLPSDQEFTVAVKHFKASGKWGSKTAQLVMEGVYGKARVFLNGIEEINYLGEIDGVGGTYLIDIALSRLNFSEDNIIIIEIGKGNLQKNEMFSWLYPDQGKITGLIRLEAVAETTLDLTKTVFDYNPSNQKLNVNVRLKHHQTLQYGPWVIRGALKDSGQIVSECLLPVDNNGQFEQTVNLTFSLTEPKLWHITYPELYELELVVTNSKGDYDSVQMPVGLRSVKDSAEQWNLNSTHIIVDGDILTMDKAYQIRYKQLFEDYIQQIKAKGHNVIYFMGYFPDEGWLYSADRLGIGVWIEMPVTLVPKGKAPNWTDFEELIAIAKRHPSVLAWTAAKGLEQSAEADAYLQELKTQIPDWPLYNIRITPGMKTSEKAIMLEEYGLRGTWGQVAYHDYLIVENNNIKGYWKGEKIAAISWLLCLLVISIQNFRAVKWSFKEMFNPSPKRAIRRSFFWGCLGLTGRMGTLGGILTSLFYKIPIQPLPWMPYDFSLLQILRNQPPLLLWLMMTASLMFLRLFQVGVAVHTFSQNPGAMAICSWLERRYNWILLVAVAWVMTLYSFPLFLPLALYVLLSIISFPLRIRDVWKVKGNYLYFFILPMTFLLALSIVIMWNLNDFLYFFELIKPYLWQVYTDVHLFHYK